MNDANDRDGKIDPPALKLEALTAKAGQRVLIEDLDLTFPAGKVSVIVGPSGAGKSVLLRSMAGLVEADEGIKIDGQVTLVDKQGDRGVSAGDVGVVFQQFALFDEYSPTGNVSFALRNRKNQQADPESIENSTEASDPAEWLNELSIPLNTPTSRLSGGQKQRLAIARTLASGVSIMLYDEPTSGLDHATGTKVCSLIRETHERHRRTSIIVTHDYETVLAIADHVFLFSPTDRRLEEVSIDESELASRLRDEVDRTLSNAAPTVGHSPLQLSDILVRRLGSIALESLALPYRLRPPKKISARWIAGSVKHYLRLVAGPGGWVYLVLAGLIAGWTTTYFTLAYLPYRLYTQPLLLDELIASIGFALYRILVPVLATLLIAARCGAAIASDCGMKRYSGVIDAYRTLATDGRSMLFWPAAVAMMIATPLLTGVAYIASRLMAAVVFASMYPDMEPVFLRSNFDRQLGGWTDPATIWLLGKTVACGLATATIAYEIGKSNKQSTRDVSLGITSTVLWATLAVLAIHALAAMQEFPRAAAG
ncbi:MAG: ATP-binding cassette domain-containing protein [Planctomycetota bacterium]